MSVSISGLPGLSFGLSGFAGGVGTLGLVSVPVGFVAGGVGPGRVAVPRGVGAVVVRVAVGFAPVAVVPVGLAAVGSAAVAVVPVAVGFAPVAVVPVGLVAVGPTPGFAAVAPEELGFVPVGFVPVGFVPVGFVPVG